MYHDEQHADGDDNNRREVSGSICREALLLSEPKLQLIQRHCMHCTVTLHCTTHCSAYCTITLYCTLHTLHSVLRCLLSLSLLHVTEPWNSALLTAVFYLCNTGLTFDASQFTLFLNLRLTLRWSNIAFNPTALHRWFSTAVDFQRKWREKYWSSDLHIVHKKSAKCIAAANTIALSHYSKHYRCSIAITETALVQPAVAVYCHHTPLSSAQHKTSSQHCNEFLSQ